MSILVSPKTAFGGSPRNYFLNSNFPYFLTGTAQVDVPFGTTSYIPSDLWYLVNNGSAGVVSTVGQPNTHSIVGSQGQLANFITTAVTGFIDSPFDQVYPLDNGSSLELAGQTVSVGLWIEAAGNVNQVGLQILSAATEVKPTSPVGTESLQTVSGMSVTFIRLQGVALPSINGGVFGFRIRITGVSSGALGDVDNGFTILKTQWNIGTTVNSSLYQAAGVTAAEELLMINRYLCKSYESGTTPGSVTDYGLQDLRCISGNQSMGTVAFPVEMRVRPSVTFYSRDGTVNAAFNASTNMNVTSISIVNAVASAFGASTRGFFNILNGAGSASTGDAILLHYFADSRI